MKKSILDIEGDIVPVPMEVPQYSYHNIKLRDFEADEFADMVLDNCDAAFNFKGIKGFTNIYEIEYLDEIPEIYARVYLYGVFELVKAVVRLNDK